MGLPYQFPHWKSQCGNIILFNCSYQELFNVLGVNSIDLAIVDPPYGIGAGKTGFSTVRGGAGKVMLAKRKHYGDNHKWDSETPPKEYFDDLNKVSKDQIIWGGNYFLDHLGATSCFLVWDKVNGTWSNADCELAWTSFKTAVRKITFQWNGMLQGDMKNKESRIHPTQKPVYLYRWVLLNYAKPGQIILDTHLGSGSIAVAVDSCNKIENMGLTLIGCEIDPKIYELTINRVQNEISKHIDYRPEEEKNTQKTIFD